MRGSVQRPGFRRWSRPPFRPSFAHNKPRRGTSRRCFSLCLAASAWPFCHTPSSWSVFGGLADCGCATLGIGGVFRAPHGRARVACMSSVFSWTAGALGKRSTEWGDPEVPLWLACSWSPPTREWLGMLGAHDAPARPAQGHCYTPALEMDRSPSL